MAVLSVVAMSVAFGILATKAWAMECVNEPDDHLKSWCAKIPGGHHPDAPPKPGENQTTRSDKNWDKEQDSIKDRNKELKKTEEYKDAPITDAKGDGLAVFVNEEGKVVPTADASHSWEEKQKAGGDEVDKNNIIQESGWDYIFFSCDRCSADRKCESGVGESPSFSFGTSSSPCAQVDRRRSTDKNGGWQAVSLCDPSCSGPGGNREVTETDKPGEKKKKEKLECEGLGKNVDHPKLNQEVTFTCEAEFSAEDPAYEFRYKVGSGAYTKVAGTRSDNKAKATAKIMIDKAGGWQVQCRVCTDSSKSRCTEWGKSD